MLRNLSQTGADMSFELGISSIDKRSKERNGTSVNNNLCELWGMLTDFTQGTSRNSLQ